MKAITPGQLRKPTLRLCGLHLRVHDDFFVTDLSLRDAPAGFPQHQRENLLVNRARPRLPAGDVEKRGPCRNFKLQSCRQDRTYCSSSGPACPCNVMTGVLPPTIPPGRGPNSSTLPSISAMRARRGLHAWMMDDCPNPNSIRLYLARNQYTILF